MFSTFSTAYLSAYCLLSGWWWKITWCYSCRITTVRPQFFNKRACHYISIYWSVPFSTLYNWLYMQGLFHGFMHSLDLKGCIVHSSSAFRCCWDAAVHYRGDKWGGLWYFCGKWEELDCHWDMAGSACWPPVDSISGISLYCISGFILVWCSVFPQCLIKFSKEVLVCSA